MVRRNWPANRRFLLLQRGSDDGMLAVANLTPQTLSLATIETGGKKLLLSTEDPRYGGSRHCAAAGRDQPLLPYELRIFAGSAEPA